jgi:hypothetical protein
MVLFGVALGGWDLDDERKNRPWFHCLIWIDPPGHSMKSPFGRRTCRKNMGAVLLCPSPLPSGFISPGIWTQCWEYQISLPKPDWNLNRSSFESFNQLVVKPPIPKVWTSIWIRPPPSIGDSNRTMFFLYFIFFWWYWDGFHIWLILLHNGY